MMLPTLPTLAEWATQHRLAGNLLRCPECDGEGTIQCDCDCPHCDREEECDACDGSGQRLPEVDEAATAWAGDYANGLLQECRDWAAIKGADYLVVAGEVIKHLRRQYIFGWRRR